MVTFARILRLALFAFAPCVSRCIAPSPIQLTWRLPLLSLPTLQSSASIMATPYIPPGWTLQRLNRAGAADFASLPEEVLAILYLLDRLIDRLLIRSGA